MTTKEMFIKMRVDAAKGYAYHIGFISKRKYNALVKMVEQFKGFAEMDFDLGIINFGQYQQDMSKYDLMIKALETAEIY